MKHRAGSAAIIALIIILLAIPAVFIARHFYNQSLEHKTFQITQLTEQLKISREDLDRKPPAPSPLPQAEQIGVIDTSNISSKNTYSLNCWHGQLVQNNPLSKTLMDILEPQERVHDICINSELQKAALFTTGNNMILKVYDLKSKELKTATDKIYAGGGTCELHIYLWSRENDIYYKTVTCDAPLTKPLIDHLGKIHLSVN